MVDAAWVDLVAQARILTGPFEPHEACSNPTGRRAVAWIVMLSPNARPIGVQRMKSTNQ